ncbi:hypothetical protein OAS06_01575 [Gammaproteobacteria bacterium]|nr:hypothetical protein [Gammaproteobacteria bacterium]
MSKFLSSLLNVETGLVRPIIFVFIFKGDWPRSAFELNLKVESDIQIFESVIDFIESKKGQGWGIAQFKSRKEFNKGRRLVGQHLKLSESCLKDEFGHPAGIQIGKFQGLVEPLGYCRHPLPEESKLSILQDHRSGFSVSKIADDWDLSESYIRSIINKDKPPVSPSKKTINKGFFESEPPSHGRVARARGCFVNVE